MTPELFSDAMNEIGAKYVEEALTYKRPAQRSFWSKLAKRAAMVALVALLALSGFAVASPAARAAMIHWVETWTGSQVSYEYAGDAPTGELPFYAITALPDGYTLDEDMSYEDSGFRQLCYRSGDDLILFSYIYMQDDSFSYYDMGEDTEISEVIVNGGTFRNNLYSCLSILGQSKLTVNGGTFENNVVSNTKGGAAILGDSAGAEITVNGGIYRNGTKTAADNQKHRLVRCKFCDLKTLQAGAGQQLLADQATGYDRLSFRKVLQCLREVAADLRSGRNAQLVCQAGRHVGLMDYCRDLALLCSKNHGNRYETAL